MDLNARLSPKPSMPTVHVLAVFAKLTPASVYGYEIFKRTKISLGTLYSILNRLEDQGVIESEWQSVDLEGNSGRPFRVYRTTPHGQSVIINELDNALNSRDFIDYLHSKGTSL